MSTANYDIIHEHPNCDGAAVGAAMKLAHQSSAVPTQSVPEPLRELVERGMAKDPTERWQSANEFVMALETAAVAAYGEDWEEDFDFRRRAL